MIVSINPTYYCNFRCDFCYLTEEQLSDRKLLSLDVLSKRLAEITAHEPIEKVDLYGGELGLLDKKYWNDLIELLGVYGITDINLNTNLSMVNDITLDNRVHTSVSYDFSAREDHHRVFRNMALLDKPFSILMLASPKVLDMDVDTIIAVLNTLSKLQSVEIKPYSTNQANQHHVDYTDYEDFVKKFIESNRRTFSISNEAQLKATLEKNNNSFSDDHVYITPNGKFAVLEFDKNDDEYFLELDTIDDYYDWCDTEHDRVGNNQFCAKCKYYGRCLSEHLREVKSIDKSCNGFVKLIDWYDARLEN